MKPYLICHIVSSVDGRISDKRWPIGGEVFEPSAAMIKSDGWIVGRATMQEFSSKKSRRIRKGKFPTSKKDFVAEHSQKTYAAVLDPSGKLNWDVNYVDTEHVIEILTEKVSGEYLDYLRERQVSYIFAGKSTINLELAVKKLYTLFGIKRMIVQGGGLNNGSFLSAGLLDEISLIIAPVADGRIGTTGVFDLFPSKKDKPPIQLKLKSSRRYKKDYMWLKFSVDNELIV